MADMTPQLPGTMIVNDPPDPWEAAFGEYQQALVDLNGDGIPDGVRSLGGQVQPLNNRIRQSISRQAMAGREPTVDMGAIGRRTQASEENSQSFERGMSELVLGQPARAVNAMAAAYDDPSLGNVGNAALQTGLAAAPFLPLKYAAPMMGTDIGIEMNKGGQAQAQSAGTEARLRRMSPQELTAFQGSIGVPPDGRIGPQTIAAAQRYEADQRAKSDQAAEIDRIRAQGDAAAALERARILAEAEAESNRAKAASELSAEEAQRPFLQRNPGYSTYAPYVAGAAAAALPMAGALLSRRAATMPARQQARAIDSAVDGFNAAPTPLAARTAAQAVSQPPAQAAAPSGMNAMLDYASMGVGASLPSAAVVAPYFVDYMQPAGTEAHQKAAEQFTVPKLVERMTGPFALGMAMAGGGRFLGEKAGQAFINPAPRGSNMAQATVLNEMVKRSPDDVALTDNLVNSIRGGQTAVLENKRLQGAIDASPPNISFNDIQMSNIATQPRRGGSGGGQGARALPESDPGAGRVLPPPDRSAGPQEPVIGGGPTTPPNPPPNPSRAQRTRSSLEDSQRVEIQEQLLSGVPADTLAQQYGVGKASLSSIQKKTEELVNAAGGDRAEALRQIQGYKRFRDYTYAAPPVAAGGALNAMMQNYRGE